MSGSTSSSRVRLRNFSMDSDTPPENLQLKQPMMSYNFEAIEGGVKSSGGFTKITDLATTEKECKICYYRSYREELGRQSDKIVCQVGGEFDFYDVFTKKLHILMIDECDTLANFINYRLSRQDVLIITASNYPMTVWEGTGYVQTIEDAPKVSSMCLSNERLFATDSVNPSRLWFSDDLDPRNWSISLDEAGYIDLSGLKGKLLKVVDFGDYVYIFRSYGITRLAAAGEQTQFSINEIASTGLIYPDSIIVCDDRIVFLSSEGLFSFDGLQVSRIKLPIERILNGSDKRNLSCGYHQGCYFLTMRYDFGDGEVIGCETDDYVNNCVLKVDLTKNAASLIRGVDVLSMTAVLLDEGSYLAAIERRGSRTFLSKYSETAPTHKKRLDFSPSDFSSDRLKLVTKLFVSVAGEADITIKLDGRDVTRSVSGDTVIPIYKTAKKIGISITSNADAAEIAALSMEVKQL